MLGPSQPAASWQRLNWAAPTCLQEVSTDPEKLGPRAADVGGKKMLQLLNDVSGAFRPGILTALVGSSGAGKTTLMDVLAGRKTSESPMQSVTGNGVERGGQRRWELEFGHARVCSMLTNTCPGAAINSATKVVMYWMITFGAAGHSSPERDVWAGSISSVLLDACVVLHEIGCTAGSSWTHEQDPWAALCMPESVGCGCNLQHPACLSPAHAERIAHEMHNPLQVQHI